MGDIVKKVSLAGLMEGWDDDCYAYVRPATFEDRKGFRELSNLSDDAATEWQSNLVSTHFVSGKVRALNSSDLFALVDMEPEHLTIGAVNDKLAMGIMGFDFDPKDLELAAAPASTTEPSTTETPSSETSGQNSPTK